MPWQHPIPPGSDVFALSRLKCLPHHEVLLILLWLCRLFSWLFGRLFRLLGLFTFWGFCGLSLSFGFRTLFLVILGLLLFRGGLFSYLLLLFRLLVFLKIGLVV